MATIPVLLPGNSHGRRSLVGYSPWGHKESDTTERLHFHFRWVSVLPSRLWEPLSQVVHSFPISPAAPPVLPSVPAALTSARGHHAHLPAALLQEPPLPFSGGSSEAQRGNDCPGSALSSSPTPNPLPTSQSLGSPGWGGPR